MGLKRFLQFSLLLLLAGLPVGAFGQNFTTVTATMNDPNGIPYAFGLVTFSLGPLPFTTAPTLPTTPPTPVAQSIGPIGLDNNGRFSVNLPSNAAITPGSTQWTATVCSAPSTADISTPILGNCFTAAAITISGSSQDISATLNAAAFGLTVKVNLARVFNTLPAATIVTVGNNFTVTMATAPTIPATGTTYRFQVYASETVIGASCAGNPVVAIAVKYQDPNESSAASTTQITYTITTNGALGRLVPVLTTPMYTFTAKPGTAVQYTATFTAGGSCSPNPTVQIFPTLEQM